MIDLTDIPNIISAARNRLEEAGRKSSDPIEFHIKGTYANGSLIDTTLTATGFYTPPWGWPVLDSDESTSCISQALSDILEKADLSSLALIMEQQSHDPVVVYDFFTEEQELPKRQEFAAPFPLIIRNMDDVLARICETNLEVGQCIIISALDDTFSLSDDLSAHMMYALDGSNDILWYGASAGNGRDPDDVLDAVRRECSYTGRNRTILAVSGSIVDFGDGRAFIRKPSRVALLEVNA